MALVCGILAASLLAFPLASDDTNNNVVDDDDTSDAANTNVVDVYSTGSVSSGDDNIGGSGGGGDSATDGSGSNGAWGTGIVGWRLMMGVTPLCCALQLVLAPFFLHESPRWLLQHTGSDSDSDSELSSSSPLTHSHVVNSHHDQAAATLRLLYGLKSDWEVGISWSMIGRLVGIRRMEYSRRRFLKEEEEKWFHGQ
jgi:hypothetical protein